MALQDFIVNAFSDVIATVGESKLVDVLQKLHDSKPEAYKAAIFGGVALVTELGPLVEKSGTKIDDAFVNGLKEAIETSAKQNGITL